MTEFAPQSYDEIKDTLVKHGPLILTFPVNEDVQIWFTQRQQQIDSGFTIPLTEKKPLYYTSLNVWGYSDDVNAFLCRGIMGPDFGCDGFFWYPYHASLLDDAVWNQVK